ncbi:neuroparsin-A-like [Panulirus ornatus]|uniref:neuroparsin-A-like n=1 Tax=Panulirus ornatus TaxID=150431 RepID=UPI003A879D98
MKTSCSSGVTFFLASCSLLLLLQYAAAGPACPHRNEIVPEDLSKCKYGVVLGWCGNLACGKGPGDTCGGRWEEHGNCGKGMYCVCGHCAGCSSKLKCALGRFC